MKKIFLVASVVFLLLIGSLQLYVYMLRPTSSDVLREKVGNLPELSLKDRNGNPVTIQKGNPVILVYFNSTCDHCHRQLNAIRSVIKLLSETQLVLMSSQPMDDVIPVTDGLGFDNDTNVQVVQITHEELAEKFGTLGLPHIFVYSADGRLLSVFAGETDVATIAELLR